MAGGQEDTTIRFVLADDVRRGGGGEDTVLANDELGDTVGRTDLEDRLDSLWREIPAIATDDESLSGGVDGVEDGLDEVLGVML